MQANIRHVCVKWGGGGMKATNSIPCVGLQCEAVGMEAIAHCYAIHTTQNSLSPPSRYMLQPCGDMPWSKPPPHTLLGAPSPPSIND